MKEIVIPTAAGPIVLRPRQVVKCEGAYFMIESVNEVRNGQQIRMYRLNDTEALKYYVPAAPVANAPASGQVPAHSAQTAQAQTPAPAPAAPTTPAPTAPTTPAPTAPATPGEVPGAAPAGQVPSGPAPETAPPGEVPASMAPSTANPEDAPKPIQGLSPAEVQDGLASGKYTQNSEGDVFKGPNYDKGGAAQAPNHIINPAAADGLSKQDVIDAQQ